jgi:hypothetical protein
MLIKKPWIKLNLQPRGAVDVGGYAWSASAP